MIYTITYFEASRAAGDDTCNGTFDRAKALATAAVQSGLAERAEVRDIDRRLVYRFQQGALV